MTETKLEIPDLVGGAGRAEIIAAAIRDLQRQRENLSVVALINDAADTDIVPGLTLTFIERREQIDTAIERIAAEHPEEMRMISEATQA